MRGTLFQIYRRKNWNRYSPVLDPVRPPFASLSLCPLFIGYLPAFDRLNGSIVNVKFLESIEEEEKRKKKDRNRITSWNVQIRRIYVYHFPEWRRIYRRSETRRKNDTDLTLQFRRLNCVHAVYISSGPRLTIAADRIDRDFSRCLWP